MSCDAQFDIQWPDDKRWRVDGNGIWGKRIEITKFDADAGTLRCGGWWAPRPNKGDHLEVSMQSGRVTLWEFTDVEHCFDPPDMFFASAKFLRYLEPADGEGVSGA